MHHIVRHSLQFITPFIIAEIIFRYFNITNAELIGWESASLTHTFIAAYKLMEPNYMPFVSIKFLTKVKFTILGLMFLVIFGKIILVVIEVLHVHDLEYLAHILIPHWLIIPVILFFISNIILYNLTVKQRNRSSTQMTEYEKNLLALIFQVDIPIVIPYIFVLLYGYIFIQGDASNFFRGMSCALLMASNILTISYEYVIIRKQR